MRTFTKRGFGQIYVAKEEDIEKVKDIIKAMDEFEFSYMPKDLIVPFTEYPKVVYMHTFSDLNLNHLTALCFARDIPVFCFDSGFDENPTTFTLPSDASRD